MIDILHILYISRFVIDAFALAIDAFIAAGWLRNIERLFHC